MKQTLKQTADRTPDQAEKIRTKKRQERLRRTAETSLNQAGTMNAQEAGQANRFSEPRTKVYTYRVTESGSMAGVTNDLAAAEGKTFTVTVTDNGDGTISAVSSWQNDFALSLQTHTV